MILKKFVYKKIDSTNNQAIKIIKRTKNKSGIIIAHSQDKGRGRYGRKWISYKGNLFVTIFFVLENNMVSLKKITQINCLLVKKLLSFYCKKIISIKRPNDLLINKKKISGILQEVIKKDNIKYMIVGIGINLIKNPKIKNYPTTNLSEESVRPINKNKIIMRLKELYEKSIPKINSFTENRIL